MSEGVYTAEQARAYARQRRRARQQQVTASVPTPVWSPQHRATCDRGPDCACPQVRAYASAADQIGYGGSAGGGKSDLQLGLAGTEHRWSMIFRRVFPSLRGMIKRSREIFNADSRSHLKDSFNESLHIWNLADGRVIEFGSVQYEADLKKFQGQPHDFLGVDEATEFPESFIRFLMAWNRTSTPGQRCRLLLTFNPPMDDSGNWIIGFFAPWLDETYPDPAVDGELRYVARINDRDVFYRAPDDVPDDVRVMLEQQATDQDLDDWRAVLKTRTFFHASLRDNPILAATGYGATIESLPEPLRSLLKGNFAAARIANPWQVIPTGWVKLAQGRWKERNQPDVPLQSMGVDPVRGGGDQFAIAKLYGNWCAPIETWPGSMVPDGPAGAALVVNALDGEVGVSVGVDIIGYGSSTFDSLVAQDINAIAVNNSEGAPDARDRSGKFKFRNVRAASYWTLREALDPEHGDDIALPDDPELLADLCAPTFRVTTAGIILEEKEDIKARIGRSPDKGDALVIAHWVHGQSGWLVWGS